MNKGLSAAGVSHVTRSSSPLRRAFWLFAISLAVICMTLMTNRVLHEYLKYPKAWQTKTMAVRALEFPAVTVCGRYLIPRANAHEAKLDYMEEMRKFLESLPSHRVSKNTRRLCHINPLCTWNRLSEECDCHSNPCGTTLCFSEGQSFCVCSKRLCDWTPEACQTLTHDGHEACICRQDFDYPGPNVTATHRVFDDSLLTNTSQEALRLIKLLKSGQTGDLNDLDMHLVPEVRTLDDYGISYDSLIISCNYEGANCDVRTDFTTLYSATFGKCYMFNYIGEERGENKGSRKIVRHAGRQYGLQLYLQTRRMNMLPLFSRRLGARVVVHDPRSLPFSREGGFDLRHRDMHSLSVRYQEVNRLGPPWGQCAGDNGTSSYQAKPYSQIACERTCLNDVVFSRCKCYHRLFMSGTAMPLGIRVCRPEEYGCFSKVLRDIIANKFKCDCPAPCQEKKYKVSVSSGKFNKRFFRFIKQIKTLKMLQGVPYVIEPEFKEDILGVLVFYQSMSVINITETSIYSWEFLIANIGGNLGLFLGVSLVTFVEVVEFFVDVTVRVICWRR